jgi:hypothetical protein
MYGIVWHRSALEAGGKGNISRDELTAICSLLLLPLGERRGGDGDSSGFLTKGRLGSNGGGEKGISRGGGRMEGVDYTVYRRSTQGLSEYI